MYTRERFLNRHFNMIFPIRMKSESLIRDVYCELVDQDRIKELCPLIRTNDLQGGLWIPGDGVANPFEICLALSILAHKAGAKIVQVRILPMYFYIY
jgi:glycine/D-amino acid oxidase-like deaminating enzyme